MLEAAALALALTYSDLSARRRHRRTEQVRAAPPEPPPAPPPAPRIIMVVPGIVGAAFAQRWEPLPDNTFAGRWSPVDPYPKGDRLQ